MRIYSNRHLPAGRPFAVLLEFAADQPAPRAVAFFWSRRPLQLLSGVEMSTLHARLLDWARQTFENDAEGRYVVRQEDHECLIVRAPEWMDEYRT